ncbi:biotin--[acetyl-CoA-carboxylase] ligase [Pseudozobellia sp. WGM2]|uniref:biotin--[acetyl-CoA-carboxylase] ligase n=1 Tax=Pseudozobellia sp. WGM2 TaxID=2787625 RepID=UPI001ADFC0AE|nr:biotin--[acetyl-CoA-carboxylase] ligase [Pseudozobellia sp. WGM2]
MHLIKLDATPSTNDYLKALSASSSLVDFTTVWAIQQSKGKGQMGSVWLSEIGKNLTFSVLKNNLNLLVSESYTLNVCISLVLYDFLNDLNVPQLSIKWPNDILSGTSKLCGVLIENQLKGNQVSSAIIGIGLNVNQTDFHSLKNVTSLKLLFGRDFNLDNLLSKIMVKLQSIFIALKENGREAFWKAYENVLFRKDKPSTFEDTHGQMFMGFIREVSFDGQLVVELEDKILKKFNLKELKLLY